VNRSLFLFSRAAPCQPVPSRAGKGFGAAAVMLIVARSQLAFLAHTANSCREVPPEAVALPRRMAGFYRAEDRLAVPDPSTTAPVTGAIRTSGWSDSHQLQKPRPATKPQEICSFRMNPCSNRVATRHPPMPSARHLLTEGKCSCTFPHTWGDPRWPRGRCAEPCRDRWACVSAPPGGRWPQFDSESWFPSSSSSEAAPEVFSCRVFSAWPLPLSPLVESWAL
jgi:hypothetical protein